MNRNLLPFGLIILGATCSGAAARELETETEAVNTNWYFRYWEPMRKYFAAQAKPAAP